MKLFFSALLLLVSGQVLAQANPEIKRIYDDINFIANQLTLDTKAGAQPQEQQPLSVTKQHGHKKPKEAVEAAPAVPAMVTRVFSGSNVWGDLSVKILDYGNHMTLQVKSSAPAQGWMLQKGDSNNILYKGNVENNALNFQIEIPHQYSTDLGLTVIINSGDGQNPAFLALK